MDAEGVLEGHVEVVLGSVVLDEVGLLRLGLHRDERLRACFGIHVDEVAFRICRVRYILRGEQHESILRIGSLRRSLENVATLDRARLGSRSCCWINAEAE